MPKTFCNLFVDKYGSKFTLTPKATFFFSTSIDPFFNFELIVQFTVFVAKYSKMSYHYKI